MSTLATTAMMAYKSRKQLRRRRRLLKLYLLRCRENRLNKQRKFKKRFWVQKPNRSRLTCGGYSSVLNVYRETSDHEGLYKNVMRMDGECFDRVLALVKPYIEKMDTCMRKAIAAEQRLAVTLVFLSTGDSWRMIAMFFRMGISTVRKIVYETCEAIWTAMEEKYMKTPRSQNEWNAIALE